VQGHYFSVPQPIQYFEKVFSQIDGRIEIAA
jgi:hypothetical protein